MELIRKLIELHDKYEHYVLEYFEGNNQLNRALKLAFDELCNKAYEEISIADILSSFFDNALKKGTQKKLNDDEIEHEIEKAMKILSYISDKVSFAEYYWRKLARRLLSDSASICNEQSILMKLKKQLHGAQHINQMEIMTCLLMLFNDSERLSYGDIKSQLNLEDDDAIRVLHSLACSKYKVLLKKPNTRKISPTDYFEFNSGFTDNKKRIKILVPHSDEEIKVTENVGKDRKVLIDAAIVRIMKAKKGLYFQELLTNCVEQLINHFKPDFTDIKKSMEDLIERELIERDPKDHTLIIYKQ